MMSKLFNYVTGKQRDKYPNGLGTTELTTDIFGADNRITGNEFKEYINRVFAPNIHKLGFKGQDYFFYREHETYYEIVLFWAYQAGGATQVDLFVKFKNIDYPDQQDPTDITKLRREHCEFQRKLSPNSNRNKQGLPVWFWIFENTEAGNLAIAEDIWRVFKDKGMPYFNQFEYPPFYLQEITLQNMFTFRDFEFSRFFKRQEVENIYFLFRVWQLLGNMEMSIKFAQAGLTYSANAPAYQQIFTDYLSKVMPNG